MYEVTNSLTTQNFTKVTKDKEGNASLYNVTTTEDGTVLAEVKFQDGPIKEVGINGIHHEDLILMIIDRLTEFQQGRFSCIQNELAIQHLENCLKVLRDRTELRTKLGVGGTSRI